MEKVNALVNGVNSIISHFFDRKEEHIVTVTEIANKNLDNIFDSLLEKAPKYAIAIAKSAKEVEKAMEELDEASAEVVEDPISPLADLGAEA